MTQLSDPFDPAIVKWRVGSTTNDKKRGMALAYVDARAVMDRLDEVIGPDRWQDEYVDSPSGRVFCKLSIKVEDEWVTKSDAAGDTDFEGMKGGVSDAFKRAAVKWGIGRYLYDVDAPWVDIRQAGRSYAITDEAKRKLAGMLAGKKPAKNPVVDMPEKVSPSEVKMTARDDFEQHIQSRPANAEVDKDFLNTTNWKQKAIKAPNFSAFAAAIVAANIGYNHSKHVEAALEKVALTYGETTNAELWDVLVARKEGDE